MQITHEQEKLVVHALMCHQPTDPAQASSSRLKQCGTCAAWGDGLRTEWVTQCLRASNSKLDAQQMPHRLYLQAAPGEMRLATVMVAEA